MATQRVLIKKYENRRLYDTANSRYVNLEDIAQLIRDGADVQVVDAASGEDLTRIVLTQIIVENAKTPNSGLPLDLLRQMVMSTGKAGKDSLINYMKTIVDLYQNTYSAFTPGFPPFDLFQQPRQESAAPATPAGEATSAPNPTGASVEDLHRRIEELERQLEQSRASSEGRKKGAIKKNAGRI